MREFQDLRGQSWTLELTVGTVKRIRDLTKVNLLDLRGGKLFEELAEDPLRVCEVLYAACKPQCVQRGLEQDGFLELFGGDGIAAATEAFLEELIDFFPPRIRTALRKAIEQARRVQEKMETALAAAAESPDLETRIEEAMMAPSSTPGSPSTEPPAESASPPTASP